MMLILCVYAKKIGAVAMVTVNLQTTLLIALAMKVTLAIDVMRALVRMMIVLTMNTVGMV